MYTFDLINYKNQFKIKKVRYKVRNQNGYSLLKWQKHDRYKLKKNYV